MICVFFFFSSRRRHTRYIGDWSSDVCSSDLISLSSAKSREAWYPPSRDFAELSDIEGVRQVEAVEWTPLPGHERARSEERRVGKECRGRWAGESWREYRRGCEARETRRTQRN